MGIKTQMQENNAQLQEHYAYIPTMPTADEVRNGQYTWHRYTVVNGLKGDPAGFVVDNSETAYPKDGVHTDGFYYVLYGTPIKIVTWADGTDEEIVAMVQAADEGKINLSDYWAVGQERKVTLSSMAASGLEAHASQVVTFVLMNAGGRTLVTPTASGRSECSFIVGMRDCLKKVGGMNSSDTNTGGWNGSKRRAWCNDVFRNSIPPSLRPIFKQFQNKAVEHGNGSTNIITVNDYFSLSSESEVFNQTFVGVRGEGSVFQYYYTAPPRDKKKGDYGSVSLSWFLRTPSKYDSVSFSHVSSTSAATSTNAGAGAGISPFGCI